MSGILNLKKFSFLIYGLGSSGHSVVKYFKKNKILDYSVWDDSIKLRKKFKHKAVLNLSKSLKEVDFIVLSPGISLKKTGLCAGFFIVALNASHKYLKLFTLMPINRVSKKKLLKSK